MQNNTCQSELAFGRTIDKFQALRHTFADCETQMEICKQFNYYVAKRLDNGEYVVKKLQCLSCNQQKWLMMSYINVFSF